MRSRYIHGSSKFSLPLICLIFIFLSACASRPFQGADLEAADFRSRALSQVQGDITVTTSVPTAEETAALTDLDLYEQGIQPVWLHIENRGDVSARVALWSIDPDYFSPIEVAYMNRKTFSGGSYPVLQRWFYDNGLQRQIPAGETRSGLVFTHLRSGTKGFNLNVFSGGKTHDFTFFVPLPGFVADFTEVDFENLYPPEDVRDLNEAELRAVLEGELACCAMDPAGTSPGAPFNAVLVATGPALRRSLLRGQWLETAAKSKNETRAREQRYLGRQPDAIFSKVREDGNERIQLHLWLAPWTVASEPVWLGQVFYWTLTDNSIAGFAGGQRFADTKLSSFFARESTMADIDGAQRYLFQDFWYGGSLRKVGYVYGVGEASVENPREAAGGALYFTKGKRVVIFLSESAVGLDEGEVIYDFGDIVSGGAGR
jgi:hypothetical protein